MIVDCNIFHVMALGEQSVNFTKIGNFNNLRYPSSCYHSRFRNLFLYPSKAAQTKDNCVSTCSLPGSNIRDPGIDCLLDKAANCNWGLTKLSVLIYIKNVPEVGVIIA